MLYQISLQQHFLSLFTHTSSSAHPACAEQSTAFYFPSSTLNFCLLPVFQQWKYRPYQDHNKTNAPVSMAFGLSRPHPTRLRHKIFRREHLFIHPHQFVVKNKADSPLNAGKTSIPIFAIGPSIQDHQRHTGNHFNAIKPIYASIGLHACFIPAKQSAIPCPIKHPYIVEIRIRTRLVSWNKAKSVRAHRHNALPSLSSAHGSSHWRMDQRTEIQEHHLDERTADQPGRKILVREGIRLRSASM